MRDCQSCGLCCVSNDPKWVQVSLSDANRIDIDKLQYGDVEYFAMKMKYKRCCCLIGELGVKTKCSIYENRPTICRQVEPGSQICLESILKHMSLNEKSLS